MKEDRLVLFVVWVYNFVSLLVFINVVVGGQYYFSGVCVVRQISWIDSVWVFYFWGDEDDEFVVR